MSLLIVAPLIGAVGLAQPIEEISVVASRVPTPIDAATVPVEVIDRAAIDARQSTQVADLLRGLPGFAVSQSGGPGSVTEVRLRGAEANHLLVSVDGISINDPALGSSVDFANLDVLGARRIEILPGAQTALWGSDALAGVVNIETTPAAGSVGRYVAFDGGSNDTVSEAVELVDARQPFYYAASARHTRTDGSNIATSGGENDGYRNTTLHLNTGYTGDRGGVRIVARDVDATSQYDPTPFPDYVPQDGDLTLDYSQRIGGLAANYLISPNWDQRIAVTHYQARNDNAADGTRTNSAEGRKARAVYQSDLFVGSQRFTLAYDYQREDFTQRAPASTFGDPNQHQHYRVHGVVAEFAGSWRWAAATISARHDDNSEFANANSYRAALRIPILADRTTLYIGAGTGRKNPTFTERYGFTPDTFIGNPSLRPEQSKNASVALTQAIGTRAEAHIALFRDTLTDEIDGFVFDPAVGGFTARNIDGKSHRDGIELALHYVADDALDLHFDFTYLDADDPDGDRELRRPRYSGRIVANQRLLGDRLRLQAGVAYIGHRDDVSYATFPPLRIELDAYTLVHCTARFRLNERFELTGRIENVTDEHYQDVYGYATPGRRGYLGIRVSL